jgi:hypothetical protein
MSAPQTDTPADPWLALVAAFCDAQEADEEASDE